MNDQNIQNDPSDKKTGSIPVKEVEPENTLDAGFETGSESFDKGEASQENQDQATESAETEAAKDKMVETNSELVIKIIKQAKDFGFFGKKNVDGYSMSGRDTTVFKLDSELRDINKKLRDKGLNENQDEEKLLKESRAALVIELLYSVTALMRSEIPKFKYRLMEKVRKAEKPVGDKSEVVEDINGVKALTPQWEALVTNSNQVIPFLREKHSAQVSPRGLGELNESLFLSIDLTTNDLDAEEDNVGTGALSKTMDEVTILLKDLENTKIPEDNPDGTGQASKDGTLSDSGQIELSGEKGEGDVVLGSDKVPLVVVPTDKVNVEVSASGSLQEGGAKSGNPASLGEEEDEKPEEQESGDLEQEAGDEKPEEQSAETEQNGDKEEATKVESEAVVVVENSDESSDHEIEEHSEEDDPDKKKENS